VNTPGSPRGEGAPDAAAESPRISAEIGLLEGMATTRAIRRYTDEPVDDGDLSAILWHATRAPTGSNRQMCRYVVLRDDERSAAAKSLLGQAFRTGWAAKRVDDGYREGSGGDVSSPKARTAAAMQQYVDNIERVPVIVLVCLIRHRDPSPFEGASVYPACQNLLLAARALGYGGALTMWHQMVEPALRDLLEIPENVALSACITLGRPAGSHGPVRRRPVADVVFESRWGEPAPWAIDPDGTGFTAWRS
jgi:nitroreductase